MATLRSRSLRLVLILALLSGFAYLLVWHKGGIRTLWGKFSGSRLPLAARDLDERERQAQTEARARQIHAAVLAYEAQHGRLPDRLEDLTSILPTLPEPLTSTMPWRYHRTPDGDFRIIWEAWPNAFYEKYWINRNGDLRVDM